MKILFTTSGQKWEDMVDARFGRSTGFLVFDEEADLLKYYDNTENQQAAQGAGIQAVKKVLEIAPDVVVTGNGPGNKAMDVLKESKLKFYTGAADLTVKQAYDAFKENKLVLY